MEKNKNYKDMQKTISFLEDLCWLLDANKNMNFSEVIKVLETQKKGKTLAKDNEFGREILVGILPKILTDASLFKTNKSLWEFSREVLKIDILNWEKKSRYEMIGVIICKILESKEIEEGISAYLLTTILDNKERIGEIRIEKEKQHNPFSWNDAIQKIVGNE